MCFVETLEIPGNDCSGGDLPRNAAKHDKDGKNSRADLFSGVYRRCRQSKAGYCVRYEPRFKPPREMLASGETLVYNCLALGGYDTHEEAKIVHQIAAFYYGKAEAHLDLGNGCHFAIDSSWDERLDFRRGKEKAEWVAGKAKEVFHDFKKAKTSRSLLNSTNNHASVLHPGEQIANARAFSHLAQADASFSASICKSSEEHLASSSSETTLLDAINPRFAEVVFGVSATRARPALSRDFMEPMFSTLGWEDAAKFFGADQDIPDFSLECLRDGTTEECASDFDVRLASSLIEPGSAILNEEIVSQVEPGCLESEVTILNDIECLYPGAATFDSMADEGSKQKPPTLGLQEDGEDAFSNRILCNEHSIADRLLEVASLYQQRIKELDRKLVEYARENLELKRRNSELDERNMELATRNSEFEREAKRLKGNLL